jgi:ribosomal protein S18 acetylase RimI-like enzyme
VNFTIVQANYLDQQQSEEISLLMNAYAMDAMGGGQPLDAHVVDTIAAELAKRPYAFSFIGYVDGKAASLINCFELFSTFACKPLINIHDFIILKEFRGYGLSQKMLTYVEEFAIKQGCCKLTLEVLSGNEIAKAAYLKFGFDNYQLDPSTGHALFWQKPL